MFKGKGLFKLSIISLCVALSSSVYASGYKLEFQSSSVLADSGDAAVVEDATTNWYNSAGDVYIPQQLVLGGMHIYQPTIFSGSVTAPGIIVPGAGTFTADGRASTYNNVDAPAIHYVFPFHCDRFAFGLSVVPAWGLLEDYGNNSIVRYDLERIYSRTIDIAPSFAFKINDQWSVGFGPDIHYWYLSSRTAVRTQPLTTLDSTSRFSVDNWSYGGHLGILWRPTPCTRVGFNYRSKIVMHMAGYSDFQFPEGGPSFEANNFSVNIALPPTTSLSLYQDITPCWAMMGSLTFDQWNVIRNLHGINFMGPTGATSTVVIPQHNRNTLDIGIGTHYRLTDCLLLRASAKYEPTPTINSFRDINFPDGRKLGLNVGAHIQYTKCVGFDLVYAHVFTHAAPINITNTFGTNVNGHTSTSIDIAGAQIVWNI